MNESDEKMLEWVRFVATKFQCNVEGWTYSRDKGDLEHIRYKSDHTGYNAFHRRLRRSLSPKSKFMRQLGFLGSRDAWYKKPYHWLLSRYARFVVCIRKNDNLPDGLVNGSIITHWEEDGEYIVMMGPTVGVKVIDFLEAEPDNVHAQAILAEMRRVREMSWGAKEEQ